VAVTVDPDGNLDFTDDPASAYTLPEGHVFWWGIRIWRASNEDGEPKVYWHLDGDLQKAVETAGTLELVKAALIADQIEAWRGDRS
jgi:hypothetical protein